MRVDVKNLLVYCSKIDFGPVILDSGEIDFCTDLNSEVFSLCKSLPASAQTGALFFLMRYFRIPFGGKFSIFMKYYTPAWSIIYWIQRSSTGKKSLNQKAIGVAMTAHSMALLLHPLDDHLNDGQLRASHLTLLLRSQAWLIMNNAFKSLVDGIEGGYAIVKKCLDHYYDGIYHSEKAESMNACCELFRRQMATWLIVPVLLVKRIRSEPEVAAAIQSAYESFGIAWRLLDDINDIQTDMMHGSKSTVYACLPEDIKMYWDKGIADVNSDEARVILNCITENRVIETIMARICAELDSAASFGNACDMKAWADEFRCLSSPLKKFACKAF